MDSGSSSKVYWDSSESPRATSKAKDVAIIMRRVPRNNGSSLYRLPTELLWNIVAYLVAMTEVLDRPGGVYRLVKISSRFWNILKACPEAWTTIDVGRPDLARIFLERSNTLLLDIVCPRTKWNDRRSDVILEELLRITYRWRSVHTWGALSTFIQEALPSKLQDITFLSSGDTEFLYGFVGGRSLESLRLHNVIMVPDRLSPASVANLKSLTVSSLPKNMPLEHAIFDLLRLCPALEDFTLRDLSAFQHWDKEKFALPLVVPLPSLRTLSLHGISSEDLGIILTYLHTPELRRTTVIWSGEGHITSNICLLRDIMGSGYTLSVRKPVSACLRNHPEQYVSVRVEKDRLMKINGRGLNIELRARDSDPPWSSFIDQRDKEQNVLSRLNPIPVALSLVGYCSTKKSPPQMLFYALPSVTELHLERIEDTQLGEILEALSKAPTYYKKVKPWLLPQLQKIHISGSRRLDKHTAVMARLAKTRKEASVTTAKDERPVFGSPSITTEEGMVFDLHFERFVQVVE